MIEDTPRHHRAAPVKARAALPAGLTTLRLLLAPVVLLCASGPAPGWVFVAILTAALLTDIFDGVIARRLGVATPALRRYDSIVDTVFHCAVFYAVWLLHPDLVRAHAPWLWTLLGLEILRYIVDWAKFGREASYHMWSAKAWGAVLFATLVAILGFGFSGPLMPLAIGLGILTDLEGLTASLILPVWMHDVPSVVHAWRERVKFEA
jgi:CDP-diacylglycerol--glycerol-3-phosphate 3-phosphatidyltransferase